jgi:transcriptional regulator with XRE-family HTH domain
MLTPTLENGLKDYAIGPKIRSLRLKKKVGLVELGRHTGLSAALLSKIERSQLFPTLPTLLRIALVFGVGLDFFFSAAREKPVLGIVRGKDRLRFPDAPGAKHPSFVFESLDYTAVERKLSAYAAEFQAVSPEKLRRHEHPGGEFIYVQTGTLVVQVGDDEHTLAAGDSMYFDSTVAHGYRRDGKLKCTALIVVTN